MAKTPPGALSLPIFGETRVLMNGSLIEWARRRYARYGPIWHTRMIVPSARHPRSYNIAAMVGPEAHKWALVDHLDDLSFHTGYAYFDDFYGTGIINTDGALHADVVQAISPVFHPSGYELYLRGIMLIAQRHIQAWGNGTFPLADRLHAVTLEITEHMLFGGNFDAATRTHYHLPADVNERFAALWHTLIGGTGGFGWTSAYKAARATRGDLDGLLMILQDREQRFLDEGQTRSNLFAHLLRVRGGTFPVTDAGIMSLARQLMFAAHATTQLTLSWIMAHLARDMEWQHRLRASMGQGLLNQEVPSRADFNLPDVDAFIAEVMRLFPLIALPRGVMHDLEFNGYRIPKGWLVLLLPPFAHRLPQYFAEPERFDPLRWLPPREEHKAHKYAYIGFGAGKRGCMGEPLALLIMKAVISKTLQFYDLRCDPAAVFSQFSDAPPITIQRRI